MLLSRYRFHLVLLSMLVAAACDDSLTQVGVPDGGAGASDGSVGGGSTCGEESCNGFDADCDGDVAEGCPCDDGDEQDCYAGNPLTVSIGQCSYGTQSCDGDRWGPCQGAVLPGVEFCNGLDDDCDAFVDEDCPCEDQDQQDCYAGSPVTVGIGVCRGGFQSCQNGEWSECQSDVLPSEELCDELDNDCDGVADEGCPPPPPPPPPARCSDQFEDVPTSHMFFEEIHALYVHEVIHGCSTSPLLYCPADPTLRRHMAMMLVNAMGETPSAAGLNEYFTDLTDTVSSGYVNRLWELNITEGCGTGLFCPDDPTTRAQAAVFLVRAMGETTSTAAADAYFDDLQGATGIAYINRIYELGITNGCGTRLYCPTNPLLRSSAAAYLARGFGYTLDICDP